ncbi:hypothetical protein ACI76O_06715 [Capnocytophaga cynodegmi]|uniref:hypothetical protein n=1 Tax=Capnocytophaga cynodegmi TaxID=28189 RepID=UPI001AD26F07|nr:hypothetical protein [Capnocytophaga cynodegmi]GIM52918.1 hypothetical protein CAPN004_19480 [Capnocytophaga cynodegmi]
MSLHNLNNFHLSEEQMQNINNALTALEKTMELLNVNLTPEDRNKYGRVNEQNKLLINKTYDYAVNRPELRSPDVDWEEFFRDYKSRNFLEGIISRLNSLSTRAVNSKIYHDYDNYQDVLEDYAYTSYRVKSKTVGYEEKHREQKQFFSKTKRNVTKPEEPKEN